MKYQNTRRGFTLIELLVVVLIIGILAAVALPQYRIAVEKSRITQLLVRMDALYKAGAAYYLANGEYPTDVQELDIDIASNAKEIRQITEITSAPHTGVVYADNSKCAIVHKTDGNVGCLTNNIWLLWRRPENRRTCRGMSTLGQKVCKTLSTGEYIEDDGYLM